MRNKGQLRTIEALVSIAIIGIILTLLFMRTPVSMDITFLDRKLQVYNSLKILDLTQDLRKAALQGNSTEIEEMLSPFLKFNFKVAIFNSTSNVTQIPKIDSTNIAVVNYLIAGDLGNYKPLEIRVYLW